MKRNKTVLCVEADVISAMVRRLVLKSFGYDVVVAHDPRDAMALMRVRAVDAVVLVCDESEIPSAVRSLHGENAAPILVITESPFIDLKLRQSFAALLTRGDRPEKLRSALEHVLEGPRVLRGTSFIAFLAGFVSGATKALFTPAPKREVSRKARETYAQRGTQFGRRSLGAAAAH